MEEGLQIVFNVVVIIAIYVIALVASFRSKLSKAVGINPAKETKEIFAETIGVAVVSAFIIFIIFATVYWGN